MGNQPLVYSLKQIQEKTGTFKSRMLPPGRDYYLVVHALSALRLRGKARVEQLRYFAQALGPMDFQTVDLFPNTRFKEQMSAKLEWSAMLGAQGDMAIQAPAMVLGQLLPDYLSIAPGLQLQLCSAADFVGRLQLHVQVPVVQASGIGSSSCAWILRPNEQNTPLLGDHLLVQTISVPSGCKRVKYNISGTIEADRGILWRRQELRTPDHVITILLDQSLESIPSI